jgi:hypothetical protein
MEDESPRDFFARNNRLRLSVALQLRLWHAQFYRHTYRAQRGIADNGGLISVELAYFILTRVFEIERDDLRTRTFIDLGCGDGLFPILASALSGHARRTRGIDYADDRIAICNDWRQRIIDFFSEEPFATHHFLPLFRTADFTEDHVPYLDAAIARDRPLIFCNNFNGRMTYDDHTWASLELKLMDSRPGTVFVCLHRSFLNNLLWIEEAFEVRIQNRHLSWSDDGRRGGGETKPFTIYKYTKSAVPQAMSPHERRMPPVPTKMHFPLGACFP